MNPQLFEKTIGALTTNNFEVFVAEDLEHARKIITDDILPCITPGLVSYGDSVTFIETGVLDDLKSLPQRDGWRFLDTFESGVERKEILERRREALLSEVFFTGSNALTSGGQIVNLDMVGNRVGGIVWGPNKVVLTIGTNKIVDTLEDAMTRLREVAAPLNAKRHGSKTPCTKTGKCMNCKSPERICNTWTITEKSWPAKRISIVLVKGDYGL
ncbi:lactate utilization protein [Halodesulfovibrio spirochaetisodalis]|uniref:Lactate utilization protein B/C n=1 Tax=Halodesulfovibrio spirochaetisodalis TaxID=1560234 RepID=A0A1B7XQ67_9BACT|nr:lactate utilization protein [Halodesulfovibrio spirochaetisodalis]OBQ57645.1 lactate utilization protein B/C [Halodesulfovibrio spirochaetisodalis]